MMVKLHVFLYGTVGLETFKMCYFIKLVLCSAVIGGGCDVCVGEGVVWCGGRGWHYVLVLSTPVYKVQTICQ